MPRNKEEQLQVLIGKFITNAIQHRKWTIDDETIVRSVCILTGYSWSQVLNYFTKFSNSVRPILSKYKEADEELTETYRTRGSRNELENISERIEQLKLMLFLENIEKQIFMKQMKLYNGMGARPPTELETKIEKRKARINSINKSILEEIRLSKVYKNMKIKKCPTRRDPPRK